MTTINTSEDLLRLLRGDAHFYEQVRRLILTDELISLPARFAASAATQGEFNDRVDQWLERMDQQFEHIDQRLDQVDQRLERIDGRFERIERDLSQFNNRASEIQAAGQAASIALAMGFSLVRVLSNADLARMCRHHDARDLPLEEMISFTRADLVVEVSDDEGSHLFIAVESSYIADQRDTDRATRNADYLTRFTGQPAHAAVASARNDQEIQNLIDDGTVRWYPLEDQTDGIEEGQEVLT